MLIHIPAHSTPHTPAHSTHTQIVQAQEGLFPPTPERELLFEPQTDQDTTEHPARPPLPPQVSLKCVHVQWFAEQLSYKCG